MKPILIVAFILLTLTAVCQKVKDTIPKKANLIVVKGVSFDEAINALLDRNYLIELKDTGLKLIQTKMKTVKSFSMSLAIRIKDSSANITGIVNANTDVNISGVIVKSDDLQIRKAAKGSGMNKAWEEMQALALSFNKSIVYKTQ